MYENLDSKFFTKENSNTCHYHQIILSTYGTIDLQCRFNMEQVTELYNTNINIAWIIGVWLVVCIVQPAIPPVSGGMVICLGLIMKQFGIPDTNLGLAATLTLILDFITTATRIASNHMEVVEEAGHFKMLNRDILTK